MKTVQANFEIPLHTIFYDSIKAVLYAVNTRRKLKTHSIKNRQDGIRVKIVLNLIKRLKMVETETDSRIDV